MNVIVVHDREEVAKLIADICVSCEIRRDQVVLVRDAASARQAMTNTLFDVAIIDLTLPNIFGQDKPTYAVADQLLSEIYLLEHLRVPGDIIGITQDASALSRVATSIASNVMTIIEEDGQQGSWRELLAEKMRYIQKAVSHRQASTNSQFDYDLLIVTALDEEMVPYRQRYEFYEHDRLARAYSFVFSDRAGKGRRAIAFSIGGSGEARAASFTQTLLSLFRPKLAMMTGICGGVPKKTQLGELLFAASAVDWDYGKWTEQTDENGGTCAKFVSRPDPISIRASRAHGVARDLVSEGLPSNVGYTELLSTNTNGMISDFNFQLAPFGSGSSVIGSDDILSHVRALNDAIRGVDMECYGFYHACANTHVAIPEYLCLKSVSDHSNGTKDDQFHAAASFASAMVAFYIWEKVWDFGT